MPHARYTLFYDGQCRFCRASAWSIRRWLGKTRTMLVDSTDPAAMRQYPQVDPAAAQEQMFVLSPDGLLAGGYDGAVLLLQAFPMLHPLLPILRWAPIHRLGHRTYRWIARHRGCAGGACSIR